MNADTQGKVVDQVEGELVYRIIGAAMSVLNGVGHGYREKTYERALQVELRHRGLESASQRVYPVCYRGEKIDEFFIDRPLSDDHINHSYDQYQIKHKSFNNIHPSYLS